jgi:FkbM family methyltransferase
VLEKLRAAWRAYSDGGLRELCYRAARFYLAPPEWTGLVRIREGDTVVDLGGYTGDFARLAARRAGPTGRVLTVEPNPRNVERLRENCADLENVEVIEAAVTESDGESELRIHSENPAGHRMRREDHADRGRSDQGDADFVTVDTYTLDGLREEYDLGHVDFIKIDIEGGEIAALRGGGRTLDDTSRVMIEAYHRNPEPENGDRTCGPEVYRILHRYRFNAAVTEDYMVFGWRAGTDRAPLVRRVLFGVFSGSYGIDRI